MLFFTCQSPRIDHLKSRLFRFVLKKMRAAPAVCIVLVATCIGELARADITGPPQWSSMGSLASNFVAIGRIQLGAIKVADDYCNSRCGQLFNYCQYRHESLAHCMRGLIKCRANC